MKTLLLACLLLASFGAFAQIPVEPEPHAAPVEEPTTVEVERPPAAIEEAPADAVPETAAVKDPETGDVIGIVPAAEIAEAVESQQGDMLKDLLLTYGGLMLLVWGAAEALGHATGWNKTIIAGSLGMGIAVVLHGIGVAVVGTGVFGFIAAGFLGAVVALGSNLLHQSVQQTRGVTAVLEKDGVKVK